MYFLESVCTAQTLGIFSMLPAPPGHHEAVIKATLWSTLPYSTIMNDVGLLGTADSALVHPLALFGHDAVLKFRFLRRMLRVPCFCKDGGTSKQPPAIGACLHSLTPLPSSPAKCTTCWAPPRMSRTRREVLRSLAWNAVQLIIVNVRSPIGNFETRDLS